MNNLVSRLKEFTRPGLQRRRLLMTLLGVIVCGISVGFFKEASFGVDPFQCFAAGMDNVIPLSFGTLYTLINIVLLIVVFIMDKSYIGIATFINLFLLGYLIEFSQFAIHAVFGDPSMALRIGYIVFAIIVMCVGSALYFTANLGVSTYDAIALFLGNKKKIAPFKFVRITTDLICVALGFVMGCMPGVGTIITAFFMGPLISFFNVKIAEPMLYGKKN